MSSFDHRSAGVTHPGPLRSRLRCAWRVLRGRPTIYRVRFALDSTASIWQEGQSLSITQCSFGAGRKPNAVAELAEWVRFLRDTEVT